MGVFQLFVKIICLLVCGCVGVLCCVVCWMTYGSVVEFEMLRNIRIRDDIRVLVSYAERTLELEIVTRYESRKCRDCNENALNHFFFFFEIVYDVDELFLQSIVFFFVFLVEK